MSHWHCAILNLTMILLARLIWAYQFSGRWPSKVLRQMSWPFPQTLQVAKEMALRHDEDGLTFITYKSYQSLDSVENIKDQSHDRWKRGTKAHFISYCSSAISVRLSPNKYSGARSGIGRQWTAICLESLFGFLKPRSTIHCGTSQSTQESVCLGQGILCSSPRDASKERKITVSARHLTKQKDYVPTIGGKIIHLAVPRETKK